MIGVRLDEAGWVAVPELLAALAAHGRSLSRAELVDLVATSDKQRFALDEARDRIRANQGHSVDVELGHLPADPPERLFHGTVAAALPSIRELGLQKRDRHHVHLSADAKVASAVGGRRGKPVVIEVRASEMAAEGHVFFRTPNGVWLVDAVPSAFLVMPAGKADSAREGLAARAQQTLDAVERGAYDGPSGRVELGPSIAAAVAGSRVWMPAELMANALPPVDRAGSISVDGRTTMQAMQDLHARGAVRVGCLNFASAKNPGGGFASGAQAQEESLARASALVACLQACPSYYASNRSNRSSIYLDLVQHAPGVPFFRDDQGRWLERPYLADVITAPAPNAGAVASNEPEQLPLVRPALRRRAELVLRLAAITGVQHLVLGAWGCGVFRNDPEGVADVFAELLLGDPPLRGCFEQVVFAVFDPRPGQPTLASFHARLSAI